jgi:hypothetical protein
MSKFSSSINITRTGPLQNASSYQVSVAPEKYKISVHKHMYFILLNQEYKTSNMSDDFILRIIVVHWCLSNINKCTLTIIKGDETGKLWHTSYSSNSWPSTTTMDGALGGGRSNS